MKITPIADDLGTQSLKTDNSIAPIAQSVTAVAATRGIHTLSGPTVIQENTKLLRRHKERRTQGRRIRNTRVMLDTRGYHERRRKQRRGSRRSGKQSFYHHGIDIKV